jgi:hypothetical protein
MNENHFIALALAKLTCRRKRAIVLAAPARSDRTEAKQCAERDVHLQKRRCTQTVAVVLNAVEFDWVRVKQLQHVR